MLLVLSSEARRFVARRVCNAAGCSPPAGLDAVGLTRIYTDLGLGNIDDDFAALGLASEPASEPVA